MRVPTDGQTDRQTDANRFYNLSHAICYSYGQIKSWRRIFLWHSVSLNGRDTGSVVLD